MVTSTLTVLFLVFSSIIIQESHGMTLNVTGIVTSAFTPFYDNGLLNLNPIPRFAQTSKDYGVENIVLVAYAGEGPSLNLTERQAVVSKWVEAGRPLGLKFIVEVGGLPLFDTVELVKFCSKLKVAAILVLPIITYKGTLDEIIHDLQIISDAAPELPLIYEDLDFATNPKVSTPEVFVAASKRICNFVGVMTTMDKALLIKSTQSLIDKIVMIIGHDQIAATFATKFNASICTAGNIFPNIVLAIEAAYRNCNYKEGEARQAELNSLIEAVNNLNDTVIDVTARDYLENQKEAFRLIWGTNLGIRIPLVKPTKAETQQIATNLQCLGVELRGSP